ncbi:VOC family protein [Fictibacillus barbaricus]|uniref:Enzyme related to lactoylglutathione lyase n=1 Tax=Fictibacillus barbaricus TaxID=182136 RepID=A0ABU1TV01_9BACL|nr:VOC family protein [Fictibacillus barbaricus]MDR7071038.1 putative enzyme related to lactoylglutathione lyase [Fictibacillus barbaricus]
METTKTNLIQTISQIGVPVNDIGRAVEFYKDLLGLSLLFKTENMAFFDCNGIRLLLTLPEKEEFDHPSSVIYFQVKDINDSYKSLQSNGVSFIDKPHIVAKLNQTETWMTFFKDTEGNTHALMSETLN